MGSFGNPLNWIVLSVFLATVTAAVTDIDIDITLWFEFP